MQIKSMYGLLMQCKSAVDDMIGGNPRSTVCSMGPYVMAVALDLTSLYLCVLSAVQKNAEPGADAPVRDEPVRKPGV